MSLDLKELFQEWDDWSQTADRSEDGWQSDFPGWNELISLAERRMADEPTPEEIEIIARCWEISEETEELLDFAKNNTSKCWRTIEALVKEGGASARWQAYVAAAAGGTLAESLLRNALNDPDPYARRRGALALARLKPTDSRHIAETLLIDEDPYLRQAAIDFVLATQDNGFRRLAYEKLANDAVAHVRRAALDRLR